MFGMFKKSLTWGELEFLFKTSACEVFKDDAAASWRLEDYMTTLLEMGNYKLTQNQRSTLLAACSTVGVSSSLRLAFKDCNLPTGELDAKKFAALQEKLGENLVRFRESV